MIRAKIGSIGLKVESARGDGHPPVVVNIPIKPNQGILPAGQILQASASGLVGYDPAGSEQIVGVLEMECDTSREDSALVIVHGSARASLLKVGVTGDKPDNDTLDALIAASIFPE